MYANPLVICSRDGKESVHKLYSVPRDEQASREQWFQDELFNHPYLLPASEIEPALFKEHDSDRIFVHPRMVRQTKLDIRAVIEIKVPVGAEMRTEVKPQKQASPPEPRFPRSSSMKN